MAQIVARVNKKFDLTVYKIIEVLNLKKIYYTDTTNYCHFIGDYN
jgi:S-adenosylmethionine synthetase